MLFKGLVFFCKVYQKCYFTIQFFLRCTKNDVSRYKKFKVYKKKNVVSSFKFLKVDQKCSFKVQVL